MDSIKFNNKSSANGKLVLKKKSTLIDLTPMADIGFLLIAFFIFTASLSQPVAMNLIMPYDKTITKDHIPESSALTILLDKHNSIYYYSGMTTTNKAVQKTNFSPTGIRNIIMQQKNMLKKSSNKSSADLVMIIKPGKESSFKNFVDILDEVTINNVKHYYITETDKYDSILLSANNRIN